jgi:hypothetical protein
LKKTLYNINKSRTIFFNLNIGSTLNSDLLRIGLYFRPNNVYLWKISSILIKNINRYYYINPNDFWSKSKIIIND